ncbi:vanadium-dependent haloperoxidase [Sphingomonas swuensis]|uniref:Vanadium-dependent haloperoxidase n=1 Tax=Sphingomonas swuensis TaxID=977800 RepID=A0ABP7T340_9SPHN
MMRTKTLLAATALGFLAAPAQADTICEWMDFARKALPDRPTQGQLTMIRDGNGDHSETKVALAMFEALNAIDHRYQSYVAMPVGSAAADQQAAAMTAATEVLLKLAPANKTALQESYDLAMAGIADGPAKSEAVAIGKQAAAAVLAIPDIDSKVAQSPYRPLTAPGRWVPTNLPVLGPYSVAYRPWVLKSASEVRPAAPPALTSERYARDLDEVRRLGGMTSKERTATQTLMARYRINSDEMPALREMMDQQGRRLVDNARVFALYSMIGDDAGMAMADGKLFYNYWRPITAIRNADADDNPATSAEPGWLPLINTPGHPEYPCGHCIGAGATAELMTAVGGLKPAWGVRIASGSLGTSAVQVTPDWDEWARQVSFSRTLGGVHYRFSNEAGEAMGRKVARLGLERALQPLPAAEVRPAS